MKKRILGLALILGVILACGVQAFALSKPTFTTTTTALKSAKVGDGKDSYSVNIDVSHNGSSDNIALYSTTPKASFDFYGLQWGNNSATRITASTKAKVTITISNTKALPEMTQKNKPFKFKIVASNDQGTTEKEFTIAIEGVAPAFKPLGVSANAKAGSTDIGQVYFNGTTGGFKQGVGVTGKTIPSSINVYINTKGTKPITFSVTGLPDGITWSRDTTRSGYNPLYASENSGVANNAASHDAGIKLSGTFNKAGNYTVRVTAENAAGKATKNYTLTVLASPDISTSTLPEATYLKEYKVKLTGTGGDKNHPLKWYDIGTTKLPAGLRVLSLDGQITGTISKDTIKFGLTSKDATYSVTLGAVSYAEDNYNTYKGTNVPSSTTTGIIAKKTLSLKVKNVKPTFLSTDKYADLTVYTSQDIKDTFAGNNAPDKYKPIALKDKGFRVIAEAAGKMKWTVQGLPDGIKVTSSDTQNWQHILEFSGKPTTAAKSLTTKVIAENGAGSTTLNIKWKVDAPAPTLTVRKGFAITGSSGIDIAKAQATEKVSGSVKITDNFANTATDTKLTLTATPGPIKWKATNLPAGLTLTESKDNPTVATITGKFTKESKLDKDGRAIYTITATNTVTNKTVGVSADLRVYSSPDLSGFSKLADITTGKKYNAAIKLKGNGAKVKEIKITAPSAAELKVTKTAQDFKASQGNTVFGKFRFVSDDKGNNTLYVSMDRIPTGGQIGVAVTATNPAGMDVTRKVSASVKGVAPKFVTSNITTDFTKGTAITKNISIDVTGTKPIRFVAYIASGDAKKIGLENKKYPITINNSTGASNISPTQLGGTNFLTFASVDTADGTTLKIVGDSNNKPMIVAKNLPVTIEAYNAMTTTTNTRNGTTTTTEKPVKKAYKITINGAGDPVWTVSTGNNKKKASNDITINATAGTLLSNTPSRELTLYASGDKPYIVTTSQKSGDANVKNGIVVTYVANDGIKISGTPTDGKETKTVIKLGVTSPVTKKGHNVTVTVIGGLVPTITEKDVEGTKYAFAKDFELGKNVNVKLAAKGSKTIKWKMTTAQSTGNDITSTDLKDKYGLTFDPVAGTIKGTATRPTSSGNDFARLTLKVSASNGAGSSGVSTVRLGIKGKKPTFKAKTFTISASKQVPTTAAYSLISDAVPSGDKTGKVQWSIVAADLEKASKIGITGMNSTNNAGKFSGTSPVATKGTSIRVKASNLGNEATGTVKFIIQDEPPVIKDVTIAGGTASATRKATETATLELSSKMTGDTQINWKVSKAPTNGIAAKVSATKADNGKTATLTLTIPKGLKTATSSDMNIATTFEVTATNKQTNKSGTKTLNFNVNTKDVWDSLSNGALPEDNTALPEDEEFEDESVDEVEVETEAEADEAEADVTIGNERTAAGLTAGELRTIEEGGYVIAAVLPEITAAADGQYDFDVDLDEAAPEGAELVWFAFPRTARPSEDDQIAEFYDEAGAEIDTVPASHKVVVSPWLKGEVTYAPVIAVKDDNAKSAKGTLEGVQAGDTVTEEALKGE